MHNKLNMISKFNHNILCSKLFPDSIQALDVALVVAVLMLEVWVVSLDNSEHADGGPGGDDGLQVPLGSPVLARQCFDRGVLTVHGVVLLVSPGIFQGPAGPPVEQSHADAGFLLAACVGMARVVAGRVNPPQSVNFSLAIFLKLWTGSQDFSVG